MSLNNKKDMCRGLKDGLPIGLGYLSVSFAFGISTVKLGFRPWQAVIISMTNLTSAGQLAGVTLIALLASFAEIGLSQLIINLRYSLMSISLSQKLDSSIKTSDRFILSFFITDEIFAVASSYPSVGKTYFRYLAVLPFLGWTLGTFLGAVSGSILPEILVSCLGIAIYGMFVAIIIPPAKKSRAVLAVAVLSALLSCIIKYTFISKYISEGFAIIICAVTAAAALSAICPVKDEKSVEEVKINE